MCLFISRLEFLLLLPYDLRADYLNILNYKYCNLFICKLLRKCWKSYEFLCARNLHGKTFLFRFQLSVAYLGFTYLSSC